MTVQELEKFACDLGRKWNGCVTAHPEAAQGLPKNLESWIPGPTALVTVPTGSGEGASVLMAATGPKRNHMDAQENRAAELERGEQGADAPTQVRKGNAKRGPDYLNSSQKRLIVLIASHQVADGFVAFSKRDLTELLGRSGKTVDGVVSNLRRRGLIEAKPRYAETGGQISSAYRVTDLAREKYPALFV